MPHCTHTCIEAAPPHVTSGLDVTDVRVRCRHCSAATWQRAGGSAAHRCAGTMLSLIRPWLLSAAALVPAVTLATRVKQAEAQEMLLFSCGMGLIGFALTHVLVPVVMEYTYKAGLFGKDLCKQGTRGADKPMCVRSAAIPSGRARALIARACASSPESLGVVPGVVFLVCIIMCQVVYATTPPRVRRGTCSAASRDHPHLRARPLQLAEYNAALLSICFMLFLGFADDVLDLRWRYKLVLPTVASLPLLCSYWMEGGGTSVVMPKPVRGWLVSDGQLTWLSQLASVVVTVDPNAHGRIVDLGALLAPALRCLPRTPHPAGDRTALFCVHGHAGRILHKCNQHLRRHQWAGGWAGARRCAGGARAAPSSAAGDALGIRDCVRHLDHEPDGGAAERE